MSEIATKIGNKKRKLTTEDDLKKKKKAKEKGNSTTVLSPFFSVPRKNRATEAKWKTEKKKI